MNIWWEVELKNHSLCSYRQSDLTSLPLGPNIFLDIAFSNTLGQSKCKVTPLQARLWPRGGRVIALPFQDLGPRRGWGVSSKPRPQFTSGRDPVPIVQEAGWAPGLVWTGAENFAPIRTRSPDRPALSESLYRLTYPTRPLSMCFS
jgi:hypothetical protein